MKKIFYSLILAISLFTCEEIPPVVGMGPMGPGPGPDIVLKKVLIEEFTGNKCTNCPPGSKLLLDLQAIHGDIFIPISLHCTDWAVPHPEAEIDFRTQDAESIIQFLGFPVGFPTGVINRKKFTGGFDLQLGSDSWPGIVDQELAQVAPAKVEITPDFDANSRTASIDVTVEFLVPQEIEQDDQSMITVYLLEDHITGFQDTPDGPVADYDHRHVFRTALTPFSGEPLTLAGQTGLDQTKSYSMTIPSDWEVDNVLVVAFVHNSGSSKEIYQAEEVHLVE